MKISMKALALPAGCLFIMKNLKSIQTHSRQLQGAPSCDTSERECAGLEPLAFINQMAALGAMDLILIIFEKVIIVATAPKATAI